MTEDDIKASSYYHLIDDVYLLDHRRGRLDRAPAVRMLVCRDVCPYCEAPFIGYQDNGPGGWTYRRFACGSRAAFRNNGDYDLLLAIYKPTTECRAISSMTAVNEDII